MAKGFCSGPAIYASIAWVTLTNPREGVGRYDERAGVVSGSVDVIERRLANAETARVVRSVEYFTSGDFGGEVFNPLRFGLVTGTVQ
jgi:hypothetical protein